MRKGCNKQAEKQAKSQPAEGCNQGAIRVQLGCNQGAKGCNPQKHTKTGKRGEEDEKRVQSNKQKNKQKVNRLKGAIRVQSGCN